MGADGLPGESLHLVVARDVLNPEVLKFFVSNAPEGTPVAAMLLVAFSRWRVERCFEDQKSEIGLDQYEGRRYLGLRRPDAQLRELPVPVADAGGVRGEKIRA